jgi:signal transduction histidine kinase
MVLLAVPALLLLWVNVSTLWREWFPADVRTAASPTGPEYLAAALERRTSELALDALQDIELAGNAQSNLESIEKRRRFREAIVRVRGRHPVVRSIFIIRNGSVEYPWLAAAAPVNREQYVLRYGGKPGLNALLEMADRQQRAGNSTEAIATLARAETLALTAPLKALVLQHRASCLRAMGLRDEAEAAYARLANDYGDLYTLDGLPYAISASLARESSDSAELRRVYAQLARGRWELSAEQVAQLQAKFRSRVGENLLRQSTEYLDESDMARALQRTVRQPLSARRRESTPHTVPDKPGLFAFAFDGATNYQSYYRAITGQHGEKVLLGVIVDLEWLQQTVCPELGIGNTFELGYSQDAVAPAAGTPFRTAFHFWNLRPVTIAARQSAARLDRLIAISSEVLAAILCFGLFVLHRHVAREREALRMRSHFVSAVSHELKTPITVIRLYSETLMTEPAFPTEVRDYCEVISNEAQRLCRLVDGVLSFSAIERGVKKYDSRICDIGLLTRQVLADMRSYYYHKGFTLAEDIARELPPVKVDGEAFRSALLNLVDNAVKYSGNSHVVRVGVCRCDNAVEVAVEDFGPGIALEEIEKIFHPFYRADNTAAQGGCGLGLYLVRHTMTAHGGSVRVKSELGQGSRFELLFPIAGATVSVKPDMRSSRTQADKAVRPQAA